jgi:hypothetical protein
MDEERFLLGRSFPNAYLVATAAPGAHTFYTSVAGLGCYQADGDSLTRIDRNGDLVLSLDRSPSTTSCCTASIRANLEAGRTYYVEVEAWEWHVGGARGHGDERVDLVALDRSSALNAAGSIREMKRVVPDGAEEQYRADRDPNLGVRFQEALACFGALPAAEHMLSPDDGLRAEDMLSYESRGEN